MKNRSHQLFISLICIFAIVQLLNAQEPKETKPKQFIYVLKLVPRLHADSAWTKEDNTALERHFVRFQQAAKSGQLILAGRTWEPATRHLALPFSRHLMKTQRKSSWRKIRPSRAD